MNPRKVTGRQLLIRILSLTMFLALAGSATASSAPAPDRAAVLRFDAIIELNAPLCRTHVVLFARYWVSPEVYRAAFVWAEPHSGSFNFPIYPPTLNVASDQGAFRVEHQFKHTYDGVFARPLGQRGAFVHKFNAYAFSDIRFAEQEALNLRIHARDIKPLKLAGAAEGERTFDVNVPRPSNPSSQQLSRVSVRATKGRFDELRLLDPNAAMLKGIEYEYAEQEGERHLMRQNVLLPARPITVGFRGKKPVITIGGEKRQFSQLETTHHPGGRKCTVDYRQIEVGGRTVTLPVRITVYTGDGKRLLRSAKLYNFTHCRVSPDQLEQAAERFSHFTDNEMKGREMLVKYWVKDPAEVAQADRKILERLHTEFSGKSTGGLTAGEQLRHVNVLLQLDWMLGRTARLNSDFEQYLSLLARNNLGRMVLVGGQHAIELTIRWGHIDMADRLLNSWLVTAMSRNETESLLSFATDSIRKKRFWTIVKLTDKILEERRLSDSQRFVAQALRCIGLSQLCEMLKNPGYIKTELGIAQAGWVSTQNSLDALHTSATQGMAEAKELFGSLEQPTRDHRVLRVQLDRIGQKTAKEQD